MATARFTTSLFRFLGELEKNNRREWFQEHKPRYEQLVQGPALQFISDFAAPLQRISPHFRADPRPSGGSLFRIHRDTRFSRDKTPYKTQVGIQFRHEAGKDAHTPGFYLHLERGRCFAGAGIWHPDPATTQRLRAALVADPAGWKGALSARAFRSRFELAGDQLKRCPRGFDPEHPLADDLRRKDFIAVGPLTQAEVTVPDFPAQFAGTCRAAAPLVRFLCRALDVDF